LWLANVRLEQLVRLFRVRVTADSAFPGPLTSLLARTPLRPSGAWNMGTPELLVFLGLWSSGTENVLQRYTYSSLFASWSLSIGGEVTSH